MNKLFKNILFEHKLLTLLTIIFIIISSSLLSFSGYSLSWMLKGFDNGTATIHSTLINITKIFIVCIIAIISIYVAYRQKEITLSIYRKVLREKISKSISNKSWHEFLKEDSGVYISWLSNDLKEINLRTFDCFFTIIENLFLAISSLVAIYVLGWPLCIISIFLFLLLMVGPQILNKKMEAKAEIFSKAEEIFTSKLKNTIAGYPVYLVMNYKNKFIEKLNKSVNEYENNQLDYKKVEVNVSVLSVLFSFVAQIILVTSAIIFVILGYSKFGAIIALANLSGTFFNSVGKTIQSVMKFKSSKVLWDKYEYVLKENKNKNYLDEISKIEIKNLKFKYNEDSELLTFKDEEFVYPQKYLIMGANGTGKSTLLKLITGLYEAKDGKILFDGKDSDSLNIESIFHSISYMDQHPFIFTDSIRYNLTLGNDISEEKLWSVLNLVGLEDFVKNQKDKLETLLVENGANLSGGQKQRLVLARNLLSEKKFLLIDEATSQIDKNSAEIICNILLNNNKQSIIMVNHYLEDKDIDKFDKVITLNK